MNLFAITFSLLVLTILVLLVKNKITPKNIGETNGSLAVLPRTPNAVSSQTSDIHKKVDPFDFKNNLTESKNRIKIILNDFQDITILNENKNYIHALSTSKIMRFHDDIEFFFDERSKVVHFRSASRVGYSDLNVNRNRYENFRATYMKQR